MNAADRWVVDDDLGLDADVRAAAVAAQASLGPLLERLRAVRYVELPEPPAGEGIAP